MRLLIDTSQMNFTVGRPFDRRLDDNGVHRLDRRTGAPLWAAQLVVMDPEGADTITVTIAATEPPQLQQGQPVTLVRLVAMPWARNGRDGVAYRADEVRHIAAAKSA
ncbi:hypothetical protein [Pseudonocardia sp. WMMC193]|uniref:hypothetical protein n=1 Tax=Pseudonocardia sp. WMMC193 TaxID=2911965 RepID=UPI001F3286AB|nr:hypothetical protein [Pseudonocardia sp. WMMC193]MCF7551476.1 hypothetical protein [Pseudonocardia sp. WMMC193]